MRVIQEETWGKKEKIRLIWKTVEEVEARKVAAHRKSMSPKLLPLYDMTSRRITSGQNQDLSYIFMPK